MLFWAIIKYAFLLDAKWAMVHDFLDRGLLLTRKLMNQDFIVVKLKSLPRNFYGRHHYRIYMAHITTDMLRFS